jgi:hypothetical protein
MPVNPALRNLARDGRFSLDDAKTLKQMVQQGQVSPDEAKEALQRYGDIMDPEAGSMLAGFTGGQAPSSSTSLPAGTKPSTPGQQSDDVKSLQHGLMTLAQKGQDPTLSLPTGADGIYGHETKSAVKAFQTANGIQATGVADANTLAKLDEKLRAASQRTNTPAAAPQAPTAQAPKPARGLGGTAKPDPNRVLEQAGKQSIADKEMDHEKNIQETGLGDYYGDHGAFAKAVHSGDKAAVAQAVSDMSGGEWQLKSMNGSSVTIKNASGDTRVMKESSCIGFVMDNVKAAYTAAGKGDRFAEIQAHMQASGMRGTVLCEELKKDGWNAVFYSPRTADDLATHKEKNDPDKLDALRMAQHGGRVWKAGGDSLSTGIKPDAVVTGYRDSTPDAKTDAQLSQIEKAPFFVGVANGGIHTFVGHDGNVSEFHWDAGPNDPGSIQETSVRKWEWDTGLYMLPPGNWPKGGVQAPAA